MKKKNYTLVKNYKDKWSVMWWWTDPETGERSRPKISTGTTDKKVADERAPGIIRNYVPRAKMKSTEPNDKEQSDAPSLIEDGSNPVIGTTAISCQPAFRKPTRESSLSAVRDYFVELHGGKMEEKTIAGIRTSFNSLIGALGDIQIGPLDSLDVTKWQSAFLKEREIEYGIHVSTTAGLATYHRCLQARFNELVDAGILPKNVFVGKKPKTVKREPKGRAWEEDEKKLILKTADNLAKKRDNRKRSQILPLMPHFIRIGLTSGMRTEEICALRWEQIRVDPEDGKLKYWLYPQETKTDDPRRVEVSAHGKKVLESIREHYKRRTFDPESDPFVYNATINCPAESVAESVRRYLIRTVGQKKGEVFFRGMVESGKLVGSTYVFDIGYNQPWEYGNASTNFEKIVAASGLLKQSKGKRQNSKRFSVYETRHTYAVESLRKGMAVNELQAVLGHSSVELTGLYGATQTVTMVEIEV